jgi:hypothetical protein
MTQHQHVETNMHRTNSTVYTHRTALVTHWYSSLQSNRQDTRKHRRGHTRPQAKAANHHRLRRTGERSRRTRVPCTRRRRPRRRVCSRRRARQVLHLHVVRRQRRTKPRVLHELARVEPNPVVRDVRVLRGDGEVGGLGEHDECVRVRHVADGRGWLQVRRKARGDVERRCAGRRVAASERHVGDEPVQELDARAIAGDVEVNHEEDARAACALAGRPDGRGDGGWLRRFCETRQTVLVQLQIYTTGRTYHHEESSLPQER